MGYISAFRNVYREMKLQKRFNKTFLLPYLDELEQKYGGSFAPEQRYKIVHYYGMFITSFLCSSYKRLYGTTLNNDERKRATLFGILTPVGDDLFDIEKLDITAIRTITSNPESFTTTTFAANVAKEIQTYLLAHVLHKEAYLQASANVLDIQAETEQQLNSTIPFDELQRITFTKGAVSVIIYHQCLDDAASAAMLDALFYVGSLYQVGNDLFDLYKDVRDNIYTMVNTCTDYKQFRQQFLERVRVQNQKIFTLPYNEKRKQDFCIVMNAINARSLVAIDVLAKRQQQAGAPVDWWKRPRKDMIVDMEKPVNFLKWFYYIYQLPKLK